MYIGLFSCAILLDPNGPLGRLNAHGFLEQKMALHGACVRFYRVRMGLSGYFVHCFQKRGSGQFKFLSFQF